MENNLKKYEKIITINEQINIKDNFNTIRESLQNMLFFIENKCRKDKENLEFFQVSFTNSEKVVFAKDLKIKWAVWVKKPQDL